MDTPLSSESLLDTWHAAHVADCRRAGLTPQPRATLSVSHARIGTGPLTPVVTQRIGSARHDVAVIAQQFAAGLRGDCDVTVLMAGAEYQAHVTIRGGRAWCASHDVVAHLLTRTTGRVGGGCSGACSCGAVLRADGLEQLEQAHAAHKEAA